MGGPSESMLRLEPSSFGSSRRPPPPCPTASRCSEGVWRGASGEGHYHTNAFVSSSSSGRAPDGHRGMEDRRGRLPRSRDREASAWAPACAQGRGPARPVRVFSVLPPCPCPRCSSCLPRHGQVDIFPCHVTCP